MTAPKRIQLKRTKDWRMPANTIKVDRSTRWGNPFVIGSDVDYKLFRLWGFYEGFAHAICQDAHEAVFRFEQAITQLNYSAPAREAVREYLSGHNLACWCREDTVCHADVLLSVANTYEPPPVGVWIRCDERMPDKKEPIVYARPKNFAGQFHIGIAYWTVSDRWNPEAESVRAPEGFTHWCALPRDMP